MASLYADEDFRYDVVARLRRLGHDVLTEAAAVVPICSWFLLSLSILTIGLRLVHQPQPRSHENLPKDGDAHRQPNRQRALVDKSPRHRHEHEKQPEEQAQPSRQRTAM